MLFIATSALAKINTDTWQTEFLAITLAIIVLININSAIFQGGIFGLAGAFPPQYMKTLLSGQVHIVLNYIDSARHLFINIKGGGGVVVATINIILLAIGGDQVDAAFYCFLFAGTWKLRAELLPDFLKFSLQRRSTRWIPVSDL